MKRHLAERSGREAERLAARWLQARGWTILAERVRTPCGEIDLIARETVAGHPVLVFVEVKWRRSLADLALAIDDRRLARVAAAAECAAPDHAAPGEDMRIDVILLAPGAAPRHIPNAWMP